MPLIRVEMFEGRTQEQKNNMTRELTEAFVRTCGSTPDQVQVMIAEYKPTHWGSNGKLASEKAKS
jgi:4-oxalocrotonate tautomerase